MKMKRNEYWEVITPVLALICIACIVICCIGISQVGVYMDDYEKGGHLDLTAFYGGDVWRRGNFALLGLYAVMLLGLYAGRRSGAAQGILFAVSMIALILAAGILYQNYSFCVSDGISLSAVFGSVAVVALIVVKLLFTLAYGVLLFISFTTKAK